jgi:hypothetical protein
MLLDAQTFDVVPFLAFVLALDHYRIFIGDSVPTNTVLFRVVNVDQLGWNFTRKNGLCALNFFFLRAGKFFG